VGLGGKVCFFRMSGNLRILSMVFSRFLEYFLPPLLASGGTLRFRDAVYERVDICHLWT